MESWTKKSAALVVAALIFLTACGKKSEDAPHDTRPGVAEATRETKLERSETPPTVSGPKPAPPREVESEAKVESPAGERGVRLSAELESLPTPNTYRVRLSWEGAGTHWELERQDDRGYRKLVYRGAQTEWQDRAASAGRTFLYELLRVEDGETQTVAKVELKVPRDFEIRGGEVLRKITGYHRLFFKEGAVAYAAPQGLEISVDEIVAPRGRLETFAGSPAAAPGMAGRAGAPLTLRAKSGVGEITLVARGESGGVGANGASGATGPRGAKGNDAVMGPPTAEAVFEYAKRRMHDFNLPESVIPRTCATPPGQGGPGGSGFPGAPGLAGARGGDSSRMLIEIADVAQLTVHPRSQPGLGGKGGAGGVGGPGGPGGYPGKPTDAWGKPMCPPGAEGPRGPDGKAGAPGPDGPSGRIGAVCLRLAGSEIGDCAVFEATPE